MKNRVIICGYPKSGNTWLTRLTAEILRCPVVGFWCEPLNNEIAIEGLDRESKFQCFKAHQSFDQMAHTLDIYGNGTEKIIYIYRDPRSVIVSAFHYFDLDPKYPQLHKFLSCVPKGLWMYQRYLHSPLHKMDTMTRILIEGGKFVWFREPWKIHIGGYQNKDNVLMLSYEELKSATLSVAHKISQFLSISRTDKELEAAIDVQSFSKKKESFKAHGNKKQEKMLRTGETSAWKEELSINNLEYIEKQIGDFMLVLGYELSSELSSRE